MDSLRLSIFARRKSLARNAVEVEESFGMALVPVGTRSSPGLICGPRGATLVQLSLRYRQRKIIISVPALPQHFADSARAVGRARSGCRQQALRQFRSKHGQRLGELIYVGAFFD